MIDSLDITTLKNGIQGGQLDPADLLTMVLSRIEKYPDPAVWIERFTKSQIESQLAAAMDRKGRGIPQPLLGIPFAIKDNIDFAGHPTTAACPAFLRIAEKSATVVQRLCDAGAIAIGKTNLDQFATGLVGTRSPYGACKNPFDSRYISGGSSSGSAVAVAAGLVSFALGTDTAGSGRVPAAMNNIVGLKPSRGLLSTTGVVPACKTLDCVSLLCLTCEDARLLFDILKGFDPTDPYSRLADELPRLQQIELKNFKFGVPRAQDLCFFGNADAEAIFYRAVDRVRNLGGHVAEIDYTPFARAAELLYRGPWVAERFKVAGDLILRQPDAVLPVIRSILLRGQNISASDTFAAIYELQALRQAARAEWAKMDFMFLPTTGTIYTIAQIQADPEQLNSNLGRYTNFVNLMDLCAIAVPSGFQSNGLPAGVSLIAPAGQENSLLDIADAVHRTLEVGPGVRRAKFAPPQVRQSVRERIEFAVVGAHLSGMPLNWQLTQSGATLVRSARTAPLYRFYALPGTMPPKPGLVRADGRPGACIELEIWEMSAEAFGRFVAAIPSPLGIGTIQLEDGQTVQGFLCESYAVAGAADISHFGGWRAFISSQ